MRKKKHTAQTEQSKSAPSPVVWLLWIIAEVALKSYSPHPESLVKLVHE